MKIIGLGLIMLLLFGCGKHDINPPIQQPIRLDTAFTYKVDSCCLDIPNIFTPNNDGINDFLYFHALNLAEFHLKIYNSSNQLVFSCDAPNQYWNGKQNTPNGMVVIKGRYLYHLQALSTSLKFIAASHYITIIQDMFTDCITHEPPALFGDMMDPRYCGAVYQTTETVCYAD
jgi:gliding motility-associated-like protein